MRGPYLAVLIILIGVLVIVLTLLVIQWILMKREQRRIEDLVELRARQGGSAAVAMERGAATVGRGYERGSRSKEEF